MNIMKRTHSRSQAIGPASGEPAGILVQGLQAAANALCKAAATASHPAEQGNTPARSRISHFVAVFDLDKGGRAPRIKGTGMRQCMEPGLSQSNHTSTPTPTECAQCCVEGCHPVKRKFIFLLWGHAPAKRWAAFEQRGVRQGVQRTVETIGKAGENCIVGGQSVFKR